MNGYLTLAFIAAILITMCEALFFRRDNDAIRRIATARRNPHRHDL